MNQYAVISAVRAGMRPEQPPAYSIPEKTWAVIQSCWAQNKSSRPTIEEVWRFLDGYNSGIPIPASPPIPFLNFTGGFDHATGESTGTVMQLQYKATEKVHTGIHASSSYQSWGKQPEQFNKVL
jgi:hypothetical protein